MSAPFYAQWSGEAFEPLKRHHNMMNAEFVVGQIYKLEEIKGRSTNSHNHEFAWLKEAWLNLPENLAELFPSPEHLRKRALIQAGYYDETIIDVGSKSGALRVASGIRSREEFTYVIVQGVNVILRTAKSQKKNRMNAKDFQASKTAIMEIISDMLGVAPDELTKSRAA